MSYLSSVQPIIWMDKCVRIFGYKYIMYKFNEILNGEVCIVLNTASYTWPPGVVMEIHHMSFDSDKIQSADYISGPFLLKEPQNGEIKVALNILTNRQGWNYTLAILNLNYIIS